MRNGRFADADERRDVADAQLAGGERVEDAHPRRIAEHAKRLGQGLDRVRGISRPRRASLVPDGRRHTNHPCGFSSHLHPALVGTEATADESEAEGPGPFL